MRCKRSEFIFVAGGPPPAMVKFAVAAKKFNDLQKNVAKESCKRKLQQQPTEPASPVTFARFNHGVFTSLENWRRQHLHSPGYSEQSMNIYDLEDSDFENLDPSQIY